MHVLRLIDDTGATIREWESEHTWVVELIASGEATALLCRSGRRRIYPSTTVTIEVEAAEMVPA